MKRFLSLILALLLLPMATAMAAPRLSGAKTTLYANGTDSSNATVTVVAAPGASRTNRIYRYSFNVGAADTLTLRCGSTTKATWTFLAPTGLDADVSPFVIECAANEAVIFGKTAATPLQYQVWYETEY